MSVFAPSLSSLWRQIEDHGIDPEPLFTKHGIGPAMRFDPNARVSYAKSDQIMAAAAQQTGDPLFGLKEAEYFLPTHIGPLGFAWLASTSLRTAVERLQRYIRVIHEKMQIDLQDHKSALIVTINTSVPSANAYHRDSGYLSLLTRMCRYIYGDEFSPLAVTIAHQSPADASGFYAYFRCPVEFDANENSLHIDHRQAAEQLTGSNRQLAQLNDHIVVRYLAALSRDDIIGQVKTDILERLGEGNVTESSVAQSLYLSTRSLNRKLKAEGTSFKSLLLEIRTELAHQYISDSTRTLTEISYMLGFSEISSFSRAYRRWTGRSPSAAREIQHI